MTDQPAAVVADPAVVTDPAAVVTDPAAVVDPPQPTWRDALPDDLKGDATLSKYDNLEAFARGHLETKRLASSKTIIPGEGATPEDWGNFWNSVGRPETPEGYGDLPVIELPVDATDEQRGARDEALKPYREFAHKIGLTAAQAKDVVQFDLDRAAAYRANSQAEVDQLKTQLGADFEPKMSAAKQVFEQIFGEGDDAALMANAFDASVGNSAKFLKGMMRLAEIAGEAKLIDSDKVDGFGEVKDASTKLDELQKSEDWRKRFKEGDPATVKQHQTLLDLAKRQALRHGRA